MPPGFYTNLYGYEKALKSALVKNVISKSDFDLINEYLVEKQARDQIGARRSDRIVSSLITIRRFTQCDFKDVSASDLYSALSRMKEPDSHNGRPYSENTIYTHVRVLKMFWRWMIDEGYSEIPLKKISAIKSPNFSTDTTRPDEIPTKDEILKLVNACRTSRDRAFIMTLYESGCRIAELAGLMWRDLVFDQYGVKMYINDEKTKKRRYSRLVMATGYLAAWKDDSKGNPDTRVFLNLHTGEPITYITVIRLLARLKKSAGIEKKIRPHLFRKARITHMIADNFQESVIKRSMWGNESTNMFATYVCLSESDIDKEFLDRAGIAPKEKEQDPMKPLPCPRCHTVMPPGSKWCHKCGMGLTDEAEQDVTNLKKLILEDPDVLEEYLRKIRTA
jgi:site-specific recombinase XerD